MGGHERGTEAVRTLPLRQRCVQGVTRARVHTTLHVAAPSQPVPHCDDARKHAGCSLREADSILAAIWHLLAVGFLVHFYMLCYVCPPPSAFVATCRNRATVWSCLVWATSPKTRHQNWLHFGRPDSPIPNPLNPSHLTLPKPKEKLQFWHAATLHLLCMFS